MRPHWSTEKILDAINLSWDEFHEKYPAVSWEGWRRKRSDAKHRRLPSHQQEALDAIEPETVVRILTTPEPPKVLDSAGETPSPYEIRENGDIFINRVARTILTYIGPEFGSVLFSFERHAAMRRRYADEWENNPETIPEIARDFDLHPKAFERYKSLHGWTHASDPFTDEEWLEGLTVDDAVQQTIESQRRAFHKKLEREKWAHLIADADKWRRFEQLELHPLVDAITAHAPNFVRPDVSKNHRQGTYDLVCIPTDLHFGKSGWEDIDGQVYDKERARELLISRTIQVVETALRFGTPARIITAVGSDFFHIDTYSGTTTSGTPQDIDGDPHAIVWEGIELALAQLEIFRSVAPLEIIHIPGNHDRMLGYALLASVRAWFRLDSDVVVRSDAKPRQYLRSGNSLLGFAHGDGAKLKDLPLLMAVEAPGLWGETQHRSWFTGHLHHELVRDSLGVVVYQMPSLSGTDRWHDLNGYVGTRRGISAYVVSHEQGVISTIMAPVL